MKTMKQIVALTLVLTLMMAFSGIHANGNDTWVRFGKLLSPDTVSMAQLAIDGEIAAIADLGDDTSQITVNIKAVRIEKMGFSATGWITSIRYGGPGQPYLAGETYYPEAYDDANGNGQIDEGETSSITLTVPNSVVNAALAGDESVRWTAQVKSAVRCDSGNSMTPPSLVKMSLTGIANPLD